MKLKKIENCESHKCFDISVEGTNCFFANGILVHNSNASVVYEKDGFYCQSRERLIVPGDDNAGFAVYIHSMSVEDMAIIKQNFPANWNKVVVYGEWAGTGIQKNVAISTLPKSFYIFAARNIIDDQPEEWLDTRNWKLPSQIYNIYDYPTFKIDIDFEKPEYSVEQINKWVLEVEAECPVGKAFGALGIGEGLVFRCVTPGWESSKFWMKCKGDKHSNSKVRKMATVDIQKFETEQSFVESVLDEGRLEQGYNWLGENGKPQDQTGIGDFIRWIYQDVLKECKPEMEVSGIQEKDLGKLLANPSKKWYFQRMNKL